MNKDYEKNLYYPIRAAYSRNKDNTFLTNSQSIKSKQPDKPFSQTNMCNDILNAMINLTEAEATRLIKDIPKQYELLK